MNNDKAREAIKLFGNVDPDVLFGNKRSSWSPPINRRSIDALKRMYEEGSEESVITVGTAGKPVRDATKKIPDSDSSSGSGDVPVLSQMQAEEAIAQDGGRDELTDEVDIDTDIDIDDLSVLLPPPVDTEPE